MHNQTTILIVDDSVSNIEFISEILIDENDVRFAKSGLKALALIEEGLLPDIILLDVMMPGMTGYEFCLQVKSSPRLQDIPIIFITASSDVDSETNALSAGAVDFIHKPINRDVLLARINLHLKLVRSKKELEVLNHQLRNSLEEVEQSRDQLQVLATAIENSPTSIVVTDLNANIEYVNPHYCRTTGYELSEVIGKKPSLLQSLHTDKRKYEQLWDSLLKGDAWTGEFINLTRDGREYREEAHIAPVKNADGATTHYVSVQLDVTARHEAEQLIRRTKQKEMEFWAAIQQDLLFGRLPAELLSCQIACHREASQIIDGDFYTLTKFGDDGFEILFGDVMGKGMAAALVGAGVKNSYRESISDILINGKGSGIPEPHEIINELNHRVADTLLELGVFVTLALVRYEHRKRKITWVNAGHTPILHVNAQTGACQSLMGDNLPLGVLKSEVYIQSTIDFNDGDMVCVYSDGLSEAENPTGEQFGIERVHDLMQEYGRDSRLTLDRVLEQSVAALVEFRQGMASKDDTTIILVKANGRP